MPYIISFSKKFVFIHVQKTGGKSMSELLSSYLDEGDIVINKKLKKMGFYKKEFIFEKHIGIGNPHAGIKNIEKHLINLNEYFKFAFIRNPWDRIFSYFNMIYSKKPINFNINNDRLKFEDYIKSYGYGPQIDFLFSLSGKMSVNFIGRFEFINEDFKFIKKKLKLPNNIKLPHINKTDHISYKEYYTDKLKDMVYHKFRKDIDYFKFEFNSPAMRNFGEVNSINKINHFKHI